ncbi:MAG: hypothetical protein R2854_24015 [Caldilineaceae bacterium]
MARLFGDSIGPLGENVQGRCRGRMGSSDMGNVNQVVRPSTRMWSSPTRA